MTHSNTSQQFLPESGFSIITQYLDIDSLSRDEVVHFNSLAHDKLLQVDSEYFEYFHNKEPRTSYTFSIGDNTYTCDVFDLLQDKLSVLSDHFPTLTEEQILGMLEQEQLLSL